MGCFAAIVGVVFLLGFFNHSAANKDACDIYATIGQSLALPFAYEGLTNTHVLYWTHNDTVVFSRQQGRVTVGKAEDITQTGSLLLKNLQFSGAGTYQVQIRHPSNSTAEKWSGRLCVMDKLPKPQLTYVCDFKSNAVNLNCNVINPEGLVISWTLGKKTLPSTLSMSLAQLKDENFMCSVENKASKENSNVVHPTCKGSSPSSPKLYCFTFKTVGAVLAGGGGLILLLLIVIIILCCLHKRTKTQMRRTNKMKLTSVNKPLSGSISPDHETMHATEEYPCPSPKPSPRACYKNDSQLEDQTAQLSTAAEEQKPSPVPKPRTKITQRPNVWMCLCCHLRNFKELIWKTSL